MNYKLTTAIPPTLDYCNKRWYLIPPIFLTPLTTPLSPIYWSSDYVPPKQGIMCSCIPFADLVPAAIAQIVGLSHADPAA